MFKFAILVTISSAAISSAREKRSLLDEYMQELSSSFSSPDILLGDPSGLGQLGGLFGGANLGASQGLFDQSANQPFGLDAFDQLRGATSLFPSNQQLLQPPNGYLLNLGPGSQFGQVANEPDLALNSFAFPDIGFDQNYININPLAGDAGFGGQIQSSLPNLGLGISSGNLNAVSLELLEDDSQFINGLLKTGVDAGILDNTASSSILTTYGIKPDDNFGGIVTSALTPTTLGELKINAAPDVSSRFVSGLGTLLAQQASPAPQYTGNYVQTELSRLLIELLLENNSDTPDYAQSLAPAGGITLTITQNDNQGQPNQSPSQVGPGVGSPQMGQANTISQSFSLNQSPQVVVSAGSDSSRGIGGGLNTVGSGVGAVSNSLGVVSASSGSIGAGLPQTVQVVASPVNSANAAFGGGLGGGGLDAASASQGNVGASTGSIGLSPIQSVQVTVPPGNNAIGGNLGGPVGTSSNAVGSGANSPLGTAGATLGNAAGTTLGTAANTLGIAGTTLGNVGASAGGLSPSQSVQVSVSLNNNASGGVGGASSAVGSGSGAVGTSPGNSGTSTKSNGTNPAPKPSGTATPPPKLLETTTTTTPMPLPATHSPSGCDCEGKTCQCCTHLQWSIIHLDKHACLSFTYSPENISISIKLDFDGKVILDTSISALNPPPICARLPYTRKIGEFCLQLYDGDLKKDSFSGCFKVFARILFKSLLETKLGCFTIPLATDVSRFVPGRSS